MNRPACGILRTTRGAGPPRRLPTQHSSFRASDAIPSVLIALSTMGCEDSSFHGWSEPALIIAAHVDSDGRPRDVASSVFDGSEPIRISGLESAIVSILPLSRLISPDGSDVSLETLRAAHVGTVEERSPPGSCERCTSHAGAQFQVIAPGDRCPVPAFSEVWKQDGAATEPLDPELRQKVLARIAIQWPGTCSCPPREVLPELPKRVLCPIPSESAEFNRLSMGADGRAVGVNRTHKFLFTDEGSTDPLSTPFESSIRLMSVVSSEPTRTALAAADAAGGFEVRVLGDGQELVLKADQVMDVEVIHPIRSGEFLVAGGLGKVEKCSLASGTLTCAQEPVASCVADDTIVRMVSARGRHLAISRHGRVVERDASGHWRCLDTVLPTHAQWSPALTIPWDRVELRGAALAQNASQERLYVCFAAPGSGWVGVHAVALSENPEALTKVTSAPEQDCGLFSAPVTDETRAVVWFPGSETGMKLAFDASGSAVPTPFDEDRAPQEIVAVATSTTGWLAVRAASGAWKRRAGIEGVASWEQILAHGPGAATSSFAVLAGGTRLIAFSGDDPPQELEGDDCNAGLHALDFPHGEAGDRATAVVRVRDGRHLVGGYDLTGGGWLRTYDLDSGALDQARGVTAEAIVDLAVHGAGALILDTKGGLWRWSGGLLTVERVPTTVSFHALSSSGGQAWAVGFDTLARLPVGEDAPEPDWLERVDRSAFDGPELPSIKRVQAICPDRLLLATEKVGNPGELWWLGGRECGGEGDRICAFESGRISSFETLEVMNGLSVVSRDQWTDTGHLLSSATQPAMVPFRPVGVATGRGLTWIGGRRGRWAVAIEP